MKKIFLLLIFITIHLQGNAQQSVDYPFPHPKQYICYQTHTPIQLDGDLNDKAWEHAEWTSDFVDIEGDKKPLPPQRTRAKMLWDDNYFYFGAEMLEKDIWGILTQRDALLYYDNDFEIFIDPDGDNHDYIELEVNALNTVFDLDLPRPYRDGGKAGISWDMPNLKTAVKIFGSLNDPSDEDEKWTVEIAIGWKDIIERSPKNKIPENNEQWRINFSRVNWDLEVVDNQYIKMKDAKGKNLPEHNWVWSPQGAINMHQPETWGYVLFRESIVGEKQPPWEFPKDEDFELKMALIDVYQKQKIYKKKNKHFADRLTDLNLNKYNLEKFGELIKMNTTKSKNGTTGFTAKANGLKAIWRIDELGQLLFQDYIK